jgi:hypothetical protein
MSATYSQRGLLRAVMLALLGLTSTGCQQQSGSLLNRRQPFGPSPDPYPVYRPAYVEPQGRERYLSSYAGYNYGRLSDWGRVRPKPGERTNPLIEPAPTEPETRD